MDTRLRFTIASILVLLLFGCTVARDLIYEQTYFLPSGCNVSYELWLVPDATSVVDVQARLTVLEGMPLISTTSEPHVFRLCLAAPTGMVRKHWTMTPGSEPILLRIEPATEGPSSIARKGLLAACVPLAPHARIEPIPTSGTVIDSVKITNPSATETLVVDSLQVLTTSVNIVGPDFTYSSPAIQQLGWRTLIGGPTTLAPGQSIRINVVPNLSVAGYYYARAQYLSPSAGTAQTFLAKSQVPTPGGGVPGTSSLGTTVLAVALVFLTVKVLRRREMGSRAAV